MLIGLTGQIGAGKSTVAAILIEHGAMIVDADMIGRQVVESSGELFGQLIATFGPVILDDDGSLDRTKLAEIAFRDNASKLKLNELVHPHLLARLFEKVAEADPSNNLVVIDAALLLDWGLDQKVDEVWVVEADEITRLARLMERGFTEADALARQAAQLTAEQFRAKATRLISNNGSRADLERSIAEIISHISG